MRHWDFLCSFVMFALQGTQPKQSAPAAADASARAAARHLSHSTLALERDEHTAPCCRPGGMKDASSTGWWLQCACVCVCVMILRVCLSLCTCKNTRADTHTLKYGCLMCVWTQVSRRDHHPAGCSFDFQPAQNDYLDPEVTTWNYLTVKQNTSNRNIGGSVAFHSDRHIDDSTLHKQTGSLKAWRLNEQNGQLYQQRWMVDVQFSPLTATIALTFSWINGWKKLLPA